MSSKSMRLFAVAVLGGLVLAAAPRGWAQLPDQTNPLGSTPSGLQNRYDRARKGANINEWVRRLGDEDAEVRLEAVKSLGDSGDPKAVEYLMQAVGDVDPRVQAKAVDYLGRIRATDATFFLIQRLFMSGTAAALRHRILYALGKIGDPKASRPILEFLSSDIPADIRGTGIYAIGEIGDPSIREDLKRLEEIETDPRLKRLIEEALQKIALREAAPSRETGPFPTALEAALHPER